MVTNNIELAITIMITVMVTGIAISFTVPGAPPIVTVKQFEQPKQICLPFTAICTADYTPFLTSILTAMVTLLFYGFFAAAAMGGPFAPFFQILGFAQVFAMFFILWNVFKPTGPGN